MLKAESNFVFVCLAELYLDLAMLCKELVVDFDLVLVFYSEGGLMVLQFDDL